MDQEVLKKWIKWIFRWGGYLATTASVLWSFLLILIAKDELHLLVWVKQDSVLYPSEATWNESLPLDFKNTPAASARLLSVIVSNYGKTLIGKQEEAWKLYLEAPCSTHIATLGRPKLSPQTVIFDVIAGPKPNMLTLELAALQPRAVIDLHLLLLNTRCKHSLPLKIQPSLGGLPYELTLEPPTERLSNRLFPAVALSILLLLLVFAGPSEYNRLSQSGDVVKFRKGIALLCLVFIVATVVGGALATLGLAKVISWFL
jgi:hypothetical protein